MRPLLCALALVVACAARAPPPAPATNDAPAPATNDAPARPRAPAASSAPAPPGAPASSSAPAPQLVPVASSSAPSCASLGVDLLALVPGCVDPLARELSASSKGDLVAQVTPSRVRVKPGASVEIVFTMTNTSKTPLRIPLWDPPQPSLEVFDGKARRVEPLDGPPTLAPRPACARVVCPPHPPDVPARQEPRPLPAVTLAPGGVARVRVTWRARKLAWSTTPPPCCGPDDRHQVDAGPLPPGDYRLSLYPPVWANDDERRVDHAEVIVEVR